MLIDKKPLVKAKNQAKNQQARISRKSYTFMLSHEWGKNHNRAIHALSFKLSLERTELADESIMHIFKVSGVFGCEFELDWRRSQQDSSIYRESSASRITRSIRRQIDNAAHHFIRFSDVA